MPLEDGDKAKRFEDIYQFENFEPDTIDYYKERPSINPWVERIERFLTRSVLNDIETAMKRKTVMILIYGRRLSGRINTLARSGMFFLFLKCRKSEIEL